MAQSELAGQPPLELQLVAKLCSSSACPTVYRTNRGTLVVQGYTITESTGVGLPEGEALVEIPPELLAEAARLAG